MWASSGKPQDVPAAQIVAQSTSNMWYSGEVNLFLPSYYGKATPDMSNFSGWGHFSQVVWKGTQQVGCASQFCKAGTLSSLAGWYTVCNYFPAGKLISISLEHCQ
jgi:hypothetical protein